MPAQQLTDKLWVQRNAGISNVWPLIAGLYVQRNAGVSNNWRPAAAAWVQRGAGVTNNWRLEYSTPAVAANNCSGAGSAANTSGGTATSGTPGASVSGAYDGAGIVYHWNYVSGDAGISCSNNGALNPTFSRAFSGVSPGGTASVSAVWAFYAVDTTSGAVSNTVNITVSLSWTNIYTAISVSYGPYDQYATGFGSCSFAPCTASAGGSTGIVASGGTGSPTYSWTRLSSPAGLSIGATNAPTIGFSWSHFFSSSFSLSASESWRCTVSDGITSAYLDYTFQIDLQCDND